MIAHSKSIFGIELVGPVVAVQAFFMISGFYMALVLNEKYIGVNNSFKLFISNRFLRLFPTYLLVMVSVAVVNIIIYLAFRKSLMINELFSFNLGFGDYFKIIYLNIFLFGQAAILFIDSAVPFQHFIFVPQAWTLELEFLFYLIIPFIARRSVWLIISLASISLGLRLIFYKMGYWQDPWSYRFFPFELFFFLFGVLSYRLYLKIKSTEIVKGYLSAIFCIVLSYTFFFKYLPGTEIGKSITYYLLLFFSLPFIFKHTAKSKFDRLIGELSFPLYITHIFIISFIYNLVKNPKFVGLSALVLTTFIAWIIFYFFERKIEKYRQGRINI